MNHASFKLLASVALGASALVAGAVLAPGAVAAIKAAFVEQVLPSRPFQGSVVGSGYRTLGPGSSGVLGVTAITLTNFSGSQQSVFVFAPVLGGGQVCGSSNVIGGSAPRFYVLVPAGQTVHLTYPSPLVYPGVSGQSCVAFSGGDNMDISVNGYVN
nr:hypothetical protein [uncultured Roseateles sp.]